MTEKEYNQHRRAAQIFFAGLERHLNRCLPSPAKLRRRVDEVVRRANSGKGKREPWNKKHESAFLNNYIFPAVHDLVAHWQGMNGELARRALLVEGYKHNLGLASGTPARFLVHPFAKGPEIASKIMDRWRGRRGGLLGGRFADMALCEPFPYKTVFECKYFDEGDIDRPEDFLVRGIYEAFYYLGLPRFPKGKRGRPWDYNFACFLAGDASHQGSLCKAWDSVSKTAKRVIWDGGNIYVMILRRSS